MPGDNARLVQILVEQVLAEDCTVIYMAADTRSEAYQIFQVLNDRGVQLTDGDMLRARTLELLDDKSLTSIQVTPQIRKMVFGGQDVTGWGE